MKVPAPQNNQPQNPKPVISYNVNGRGSNNINNSSTTTGFYTHEPNSVLDLRRSPSPVKPKSAAAAAVDPLDYLEAEDHDTFQNFDWDSIMRELDFNPSNNTTTNTTDTDHRHHQHQLNQSYHNLPDLLHTQPPHQLINPNSHHHNHHQLYALQGLHPHDFAEFNPGFSTPLDHILNNSTNSTNNLLLNWNINTGPPPGLDYSIQELLRAAECFDSNELQLAHAILERLNGTSTNNPSRGGLLQYSPFSKPLQRAASLFKEALQALLSPSTARLSSWSDVVHTIRTYKTFSSLSPIPMFTHFTTNQALLDAIPLFSPPTAILHVVDFDIGLGCRYASLMRELASSSSTEGNINSKPATSPFLRVTAVVAEDYAIETKLIRDSLTQFAHDLNLRFQMEFLLLRTFEMLAFKSVTFLDGEKTAVILSQNVFRRLGASNALTPFVSDLRRVSPNVVVCAESEGWAAEGDMNTLSFRKGLVNSLEFYSMVFESLDAAASSGAGAGNGGDWGRKVEVCLMKPRIFAAVEGRRGAGGVAGLSWKEVFRGAGFRPVQLSRFADFQAECLLGKVQVRGFDVAKRQAELVLCWHQRPLVATSAWRCN